MKKTLSSRNIAAQILLNVIQNKRSLNSAINEQFSQDPNSKDRGFIQELCYGTLRWYEQLKIILNLLVTKPLKQQEKTIEMLLLIGLYQLKHLQTKPHAAIYETAQAAREINKTWAVGLINAVLRQWQRNEPTITADIEKNPLAMYSHPEWLLSAIKRAWPEQWQALLTANNEHPPLTLRVNQRKITATHYLQLLQERNISAQLTHHSPTGITLTTAQAITQLPGYTEGLFSVQDEAAQLAALLLELKTQQRVLDACAAPGGKTAHILEVAPDLAQLTAIDVEPKRLQIIQENLTRLQLFSTDHVKLICADAADTANWWDGHLFDRILLDAPCSATGVIRRHPDIKILRRSTDIQSLQETQLKLLQSLWPLLKPGGTLVYATCSILPQENDEVIKQFLAQQPDAKTKAASVTCGILTAYGQQLLPEAGGSDGFYYTLLIHS